MDPTQPPTQQPPQTPSEVFTQQPKPNYLKTIIFSALIIITLCLIAYLVFQNQKLQKQVLNPPISPTIQSPSPTPKTVFSISIPPDETAGWNTYTNQICKYTVKFPTYWEKVDDPAVGEESINFKPISTDLISSDDRSMKISATPLTKRPVTDLQDEINNYNSFMWKNWTNKQIQNINFENVNAIKATGESYGIPHIEILLITNNCYLELKGIGGYMPIFNQILSTFKFISSK